MLEELGLPVGVVSAIAGQTRATLTLRGRAGHATVPMSARQDALAAAAEVVLAVERLAREGDGLVATVGALSVEPALRTSSLARPGSRSTCGTRGLRPRPGCGDAA